MDSLCPCKGHVFAMPALMNGTAATTVYYTRSARAILQKSYVTVTAISLLPVQSALQHA